MKMNIRISLPLRVSEYNIAKIILSGLWRTDCGEPMQGRIRGTIQVPKGEKWFTKTLYLYYWDNRSQLTFFRKYKKSLEKMIGIEYHKYRDLGLLRNHKVQAVVV